MLMSPYSFGIGTMYNFGSILSDFGSILSDVGSILSDFGSIRLLIGFAPAHGSWKMDGIEA